MDAQRNISLWINNDEPLYRMAQLCVRREKTKDGAAKCMLRALKDMGITHTPDGTKYSVAGIRHAMVGM